jgi:hypothetical protein
MEPTIMVPQVVQEMKMILMAMAAAVVELEELVALLQVTSWEMVVQELQYQLQVLPFIMELVVAHRWVVMALQILSPLEAEDRELEEMVEQTRTKEVLMA